MLNRIILSVLAVIVPTSLGAAVPKSVCGKLLSSAISRDQLSVRVQQAVKPQVAVEARPKILGLDDDGLLLLRMPAVETRFHDGPASFRPVTEGCDIYHDEFRHMKMLGVYETGRGAVPLCLRVSSEGQKLAPYEAQNAFGASVQVSRVTISNVRIFMGYWNPNSIFAAAAPQFYGAPSVLGMWSATNDAEDPLTVNLPPAQTVDWERYGSKYLLLRLNPPYAFWEFGGRAATYSNPHQEERRDYYLVADVKCIAPVNHHSGETVEELQLPISVEDALNRAYPGD